MNQNKPLKRTPFKNKSDKTSINFMSDKRKMVSVDRRAIVKRILSDNHVCQACAVWAGFDSVHGRLKSLVYVPNPPRDVHEIINRSQGGSILDEINLLAVCRPCHTRITINPKDAECVGLHLESWCNGDDYFKEAERVRNEWKSGNATEPYWFKS